ncbi:MAG: LacI family transcriptional regulator [Clostridia bacterium]|nr:LacI family transcriptional regulator [Clostridia bacterium]
MKKVSMQTIARKMGVSTVTVHKALNNQHGVSEKTRNEIIKVAYEMGYKLPEKNQSLCFIYVTHKNFIMSQDEQFYSEIYHKLNMECLKVGASLELIVHDTPSTTLGTLKAIDSDKGISGIFVSGQLSPDMYAKLEELNLPIVCIDFYSSDYPFDYIYVDNYYASYSVTKYLIKKGHRKIGFIGDIGFSNSIADRYFGYLRALNKYKIPRDERLHINTNIEHVPTKLTFPEMPTAFVCHCDRAAAALYEELSLAGYSVPRDVSVIGFDNTDLCEHLTPRLTSFGIEKITYASTALGAMLARIEKKDELNYIKLNLQLYERESVRTLP